MMDGGLVAGLSRVGRVEREKTIYSRRSAGCLETKAAIDHSIGALAVYPVGCSGAVDKVETDFNIVRGLEIIEADGVSKVSPAIVDCFSSSEVVGWKVAVIDIVWGFHSM